MNIRLVKHLSAAVLACWLSLARADQIILSKEEMSLLQELEAIKSKAKLSPREHLRISTSLLSGKDRLSLTGLQVLLLHRQNAPQELSKAVNTLALGTAGNAVQLARLVQPVVNRLSRGNELLVFALQDQYRDILARADHLDGLMYNITIEIALIEVLIDDVAYNVGRIPYDPAQIAAEMLQYRLPSGSKTRLESILSARGDRPSVSQNLRREQSELPVKSVDNSGSRSTARSGVVETNPGRAIPWVPIAVAAVLAAAAVATVVRRRKRPEGPNDTT